ncbi:zinc-dependent alcohol dehydrogenase family protein [Conexibacter arvalis]|uniref:Threonine dehydrogenase-like Zn-dependent dehydrogenase n=1 Tax=Conexibacter arvalis TaxID=912552 RepID=A0A840IDI0_9ACTN|nr:zinc-binding dehydrogenase [Conexibacter arvalis]MBB4662822.1 threonine dehydrogenase-like Zn-dependent dehydrogenase [Conexibacter arvalis]
MTAPATAPATMRGAYLPGDSTAVLRELPVPAPGHGQLLLRVEASGICGSDIGYIYREHKTHKGVDGPAYRGVVAGHEPAGTVLAAGPGCRRFGPGDRVLVYHIAGCGQCANCRAGQMISCADERHREAYGWQRDGGHAGFLLAEESTLIPLPEELSFVDGALIACGVGTAYEGLLRLAVSGADDLLAVGLGPVGLAAGMLGRGLGARRIVGVERSPLRREWARSLGLFDAVVDADEALDAVARETGGRGVSTAIDCSGSAPGRRLAIDAIAEWGRISLVGEGGTLETEVSDALLHKQVTIHASWVTSLQRMEQLTRDLVRWGMRPERIVSDTFSLEEIDAAYRLAAGESRGKVVVVPAGEAP